MNRLSIREWHRTINALLVRDIIPLDAEYRHDRRRMPGYLALRSQQDLMATARVIGGDDLAEQVQDEWPPAWRTIAHDGWQLLWRPEVDL